MRTSSLGPGPEAKPVNAPDPRSGQMPRDPAHRLAAMRPFDDKGGRRELECEIRRGQGAAGPVPTVRSSAGRVAYRNEDTILRAVACWWSTSTSRSRSSCRPRVGTGPPSWCGRQTRACGVESSVRLMPGGAGNSAWRSHVGSSSRSSTVIAWRALAGSGTGWRPTGRPRRGGQHGGGGESKECGRPDHGVSLLRQLAGGSPGRTGRLAALLRPLFTRCSWNQSGPSTRPCGGRGLADGEGPRQPGVDPWFDASVCVERMVLERLRDLWSDQSAQTPTGPDKVILVPWLMRIRLRQGHRASHSSCRQPGTAPCTVVLLAGN